MQGTVKFFNDQKGFGFIMPAEGGDDLFFHVTQCTEGYDPQQDDTVSYVVGEGRDGRACAQQVEPSDAPMMDGGSEEE